MSIKITDWAVEDRPREKLIHKGTMSLSDAELLGILISSGTREKSAVDLGRELLPERSGVDVGRAQERLAGIQARAADVVVIHQHVGGHEQAGLESLEMKERTSAYGWTTG